MDTTDVADGGAVACGPGARGPGPGRGPTRSWSARTCPGSDSWVVEQPYALLLVPDVAGGGRRHLLRVLDRRQAVVGPPRPWVDVRASYDRAVRTAALVASVPETADPVDTEDHLVDLVVGADPEALADLRVRVLEPLAELGEATRERLAETLLCWLLHQGRRDEVAAVLHVHAQTVRYRMQQVRELYGDRLLDGSASSASWWWRSRLSSRRAPWSAP